MIKDIVVNLEHQGARDPAHDFAISVAETFDAHVAGIALAYEPDYPAYAIAQIPADVLEQLIAENQKSAAAAIERFDAAAKRSMVSAEHRQLQVLAMRAPALLSKLARRFDLSVFMQSDPDNDVHNDNLIETTLFQSGRPIMVVPYIQKEGLNLDHVVCCWDGSHTAARAINDALPLLAKAKVVDLLIVLNDKTNLEGNEIRGVDMARHLARHDVKVKVETVPASDIDVASAILSYIADRGGTLIVMGGYGHARLREIILGGATRDILKSMTVPVFMAH
jgi:nucleotide-binding universal stress UspA family protein